MHCVHVRSCLTRRAFEQQICILSKPLQVIDINTVHCSFFFILSSHENHLMYFVWFKRTILVLLVHTDTFYHKSEPGTSHITEKCGKLDNFFFFLKTLFFSHVSSFWAELGDTLKSSPKISNLSFLRSFLIFAPDNDIVSFILSNVWRMTLPDNNNISLIRFTFEMLNPNWYHLC